MRFAASLLLLLTTTGFAQLPNSDLFNQPPRVASAATCPKVDEWSTLSEKTCYRTTPRYDETMAYVQRIVKASPKQVKLEVFGKTGEGRELVGVVVSRNGVFDPAAVHKANRPVVYIQNSIHAGEMDGKDASLALLRDILVTKKLASLIDRAVLVVVPIYNADGHEWFSPYNRINQNGPEQMGWRTNARQQNLNRDYMKAEAPETRAFLKYWNKWVPDFFVDDHVTDGADYLYDVTYMMDTDPSTYGPLAKWATETFSSDFEKKVNASGHLASPYIEFAGRTPDTGIEKQQSTPRFSTGFVNLQSRPSLLIEMHMLKDYATRVTGNYEALKAILEIVNRDADALVRMNRDADQQIIAARSNGYKLPLRMEAGPQTVPFEFKGYKWVIEKSGISGAEWLHYTTEPITLTIQRSVQLVPTLSVAPPAAYIVPAQWTPVIEVLQAHGIQLRRTTKEWTGDVQTYRCSTPQWSQQPFEGHHAATWPKDARTQSGSACVQATEKMTFPAGSVLVPTEQRAAKIAMHWLEPDAPDSALQWGLFDTIFEQKEYGEGYVLERLARKMLEQNPGLKQQFEAKLASDKQFASNPYARLNWFYKQSPWWDKRIGLYPVGRLTSLAGVPVE